MFLSLLIVHVIAAAVFAGLWIVVAALRYRGRRLPDEVGDPLLTAAMGTAGLIGSVALLVLWGSGIGMLVLIDGLAETGGLWFAGKVALVILATVLLVPIVVLNARVRRGEDAEAAALARDRYGNIILVLGAAILVQAVLAFR